MSKKLTTKQFVEKAEIKHGERYDYSLVEYKNNQEKVKIICKEHGEFNQNPCNHLNGQNCPICAKSTNKKTHNKEIFLEKIKNVHGDKYDYSLVEYVKNTTNIKIICKSHGIFQQTPKSHIKGAGCHKCNGEKLRELLRFDTSYFIKQAREIHGDKYDYSNSIYVNSNIKINISCKIHGDFKQRSFYHLSGGGCRKCAFIKNAENKTKTREEFIEKANIKHNDIYNYNKTNYLNISNKVTIVCNKHGDFEQSPANHLNGQGCPKCNKGGYTKTDYVRQAKDRICTFYTLRCFNETEEFYKVGITMNGVNKRYRNSKEMPYNYEIISEVFGEAGFIWDMEKEQLKKLKELHYTPKIAFAGSVRECFTQYIINEK